MTNDKFKEFLHYVVHKTSTMKSVGKTVLFKILYFTDFNYYEIFEEKLSGETYMKLPRGPAPSNFDNTIIELQKEGHIKEKNVDYYGNPQKKFISVTEPRITKLSSEELRFIDDSIKKYSKFNASEISDYSHRDVPYIVAEDLKEIDYKLVFYRDEEFSVRNYHNIENCEKTIIIQNI